MQIKNLFKGAKTLAAAGLASLALALSPQNAFSQNNGSNSEKSRNTDVYFLWGNGLASKGGNTEFYFQRGLREHVTDDISACVAYINEGHPDIDEAGHRDGIALMAWYEMPVLGKLRLEAGAGPYFSMNTTLKNNSSQKKQEYNDKGVGLTTGLAVSYLLWENGPNARVQLSSAIMPGSFDTHSLSLGLSAELGKGSPAGKYFLKNLERYELNALGGLSCTTRSDKEICSGFQIELQKKISKRVSISASGISEGNSGLTDRKGISSQLWFIVPETWRIEMSAGIGPYAAYEGNEENKGTKLLGLASMRAKLRINKRWHALLEGSRVISDYDKDSDRVLIGGGMDF